MAKNEIFHQINTCMPFLIFNKSRSDDFSRETNTFAIKMTTISTQTNVEFQVIVLKGCYYMGSEKVHG